MGWKDFLTGGVEIHHLPGDHITVQAAAEQIRRCIKTAELEKLSDEETGEEVAAESAQRDIGDKHE